MNAERLHAIAIAVKHELQGPNIPKLVSQLVDQLKNVVNQPQQPQRQQQLGSTRSALAKHLSDSASNEFSPAWVQAIEELGIRSSLGNPLLERIENVFEIRGSGLASCAFETKTAPVLWLRHGARPAPFSFVRTPLVFGVRALWKY